MTENDGSSSAAPENSSSARRRVKASSSGPQVSRPIRTQRKKDSSSSSAANAKSEEFPRKRGRSSKSDKEAAAAAPVPTSKRRKVGSNSESAAAASPVPPSRKPRAPAKPKDASLKKPAVSKSKKEKPLPKPLEIVNCGICFEESFEHAGVLDCCQHCYCFSCICQWADSSNTCPQCKRRIKQIKKTEVLTGKKVYTKNVKTKDLSSTSGTAANVLGFGPFNFVPAHQLLFQQPPTEINPFLYHLFMMHAADDDDDEDDEDYDEYDEFMDFQEEEDTESMICPCCSYTWRGGYFDRCPNCYCSGDHEFDDEDESDIYDQDEDDGRGTRENPIELD